jgi:hypothetical protein
MGLIQVVALAQSLGIPTGTAKKLAKAIAVTMIANRRLRFSDMLIPPFG